MFNRNENVLKKKKTVDVDTIFLTLNGNTFKFVDFFTFKMFMLKSE